MHAKLSSSLAIGAGLFGALLLTGCTQSSLRLSPDFGVALRQDLAAQVLDPQGVGAGTPRPLANGPRNAIALSRYEKDNVRQPVVGSTTMVGGGAGAGAGVSSGPTNP